MDITIRAEQPGDFDGIDAVVAAAFGSPAEAGLVRAIRASDGYLRATSLVALAGGQVIGHIMISHAELRSADTSTRIALLSPLAVAPDHQRQGVGDRLVREACSVADRLGEPMVLLQGDPAYYGRFGFGPASDHAITMTLPDWAPPEAAQVLRLAAWTGDLTGALIEPPAFADLD